MPFVPASVGDTLSASQIAANSQSSAVQIDSANWRDLLTLHQLGQVSFGEDAWPWLDMLAALSSASVRLKACFAEQAIGYVIGDVRRPNVGWIASIAVHPQWRRRGIASRLLAEAELALATNTVRLSLRKSNEPAHQLYLLHGYRDVDVWPSYYHDGEDGVVMERVVSSPAG